MNSRESKLLSAVWAKAPPTVRDGKGPFPIEQAAKTVGITAGEARQLAREIEEGGYWEIWAANAEDLHYGDKGPLVQFTPQGIVYMNQTYTAD